MRRSLAVLGLVTLSAGCASILGIELGAPIPDSGLDGGAPAGGFSEKCSRTPAESNDVITAECGVFVSATGNDANDGSLAAPLRTASRALALAKATRRRVYLCPGLYEEAVTVDSATDGSAIHGGVDCVRAVYDPTLRSIVKPSSGVAITVKGLTAGLALEDLTFESVDATAAGESSIAAFVSVSDNVALRRVTLRAGTGKEGAPGAKAVEPVSKATTGDEATRTGNDATNAGGGQRRQCDCYLGARALGFSAGGRGGDPSLLAGSAQRLGGQGEPPSDRVTTTGAGGNGGACAGPGSGGLGADGDAGAPAVAAPSAGTLTGDGWKSSSAAAGADGTIAQGGGGGSGGIAASGAGGAGGGCGGCPGGGGGSAQAGGSSFALLVYKGSVSVMDSVLSSAAGGAGGAGAAGAAGQEGGQPGVPKSPGCAGGIGGTGGKGGGGAGGAGGVSAAIGYVAKEPIVDEPTKTRIVTGTGGAGGAGGEATNGGLAGVAASVTVLQEGP
jgi:hypothetical protein